MSAAEIGLPRRLEHHEFASLSEWLDACYWQFRAMVSDPGVVLWGKPVVAPGGRCADGREVAFWHLMTDSQHPYQQRRALSLWRGSMIGRVWRVLELAADDDIRVCHWASSNGGRRCIHIAPVDFRFIVVLEERPGSLRLVTAYPVSKRGIGAKVARAAAECRYSAHHPEPWRGCQVQPHRTPAPMEAYYSKWQ